MTKYWYCVISIQYPNKQPFTFTTTSKTENIEFFPVISVMKQVMATAKGAIGCRVEFYSEISESEYNLSKLNPAE